MESRTPLADVSNRKADQPRADAKFKTLIEPNKVAPTPIPASDVILASVQASSAEDSQASLYNGCNRLDQVNDTTRDERTETINESTPSPLPIDPVHSHQDTSGVTWPLQNAKDTNSEPIDQAGTGLQQSISLPVLTPAAQEGNRNQYPLDSTALEEAIRAVLAKDFGVTTGQQLSSKEQGVNNILDGPLPQLVAEHIHKSGTIAGGLPTFATAAAATKTASLPNTPQRDGGVGLSFLDGNIIHPSKAVKGGPTPFPADALPSEIQLEQNTNLYLNGLGEHVTDDELLRMGSEYGEIISHKAIINSETGLCKGYGFIMYARARDAAVAIVELQKQGFQTSFARHESFSAKLRMMSDSRSSNVYISNLPLSMDEQQLEVLVAPHQIVSRRILTKPDGSSRGVGFIRFQNRDIAQACIDLLHGKRLPNHPHPLQARFADSESQKRLKQDTTLRKIYADLDMGVLRSPSGHNLRPAPLTTATSSGARLISSPINTSVSGTPAPGVVAAAMRPTNSEPGHRLYGFPPPLSHLRKTGHGLGPIPMSATTSNGSFYPGPGRVTPPTPVSPWFGTGGTVGAPDRLDANLWCTTQGPSNGSVLAPSQAPSNRSFLGTMPGTGWLLPPPPPRPSAAGPASSALASVTSAGEPLRDTAVLSSTLNPRTSKAVGGLWSPAASAGATTSTPTMMSPSADSGNGSSRFNSPVRTVDGHNSLDGDGNSSYVSKGISSAGWMPTWTSSIADLNLHDNQGRTKHDKDNALTVKALERQHLGSLLTGDGNDTATKVPDWALANQAPRSGLSAPHEVELVAGSVPTSAVPIINPQTGQKIDGANSQVTINPSCDTTPPTGLMAQPNLTPVSETLSGMANVHNTPVQRALRDARSKTIGSGLSELASTPSVTTSVSAPAGYEALCRDQRDSAQCASSTPKDQGQQPEETRSKNQLARAIALDGWT